MVYPRDICPGWFTLNSSPFGTNLPWRSGATGSTISNTATRDKRGCKVIKRILFLAYGGFAYVVFLGTFLYAVGFIGNFGTPTALDGKAVVPFLSAFVVDVALLALFAVQHSVMARRWFKERWTKIVPKPIERSTYVLFSSLALILMFRAWQPMGGTIWSFEDPAARLVLYIVFSFGWALVFASTLLINHFDLFGLRQVWLCLRRRPYSPLRFRTPGPYRLVRHPLYAGWLIVFWVTPTMTGAHLVFAAATTAYILLAIRWEENDLVVAHGTAYEHYRRSVPMLLPHITRKVPAYQITQPE